MKALFILGSRNPNGQTARAANAIRKGMETANSSTEMIFLPTLRLERCRQCEDNGWGLCRKEGRCVIDDQFAELVDKINKTDRVVFANPVYFGDLSESMRAFTDRLRRTCWHKQGKEKVEGKIAIGVCVAGGGGGGSPACCVSMEKVLHTCGFTVVDLIPVRRQNLEAKLPALKLVGEWLATEKCRP